MKNGALECPIYVCGKGIFLDGWKYLHTKAFILTNYVRHHFTHKRGQIQLMLSLITVSSQITLQKKDSSIYNLVILILTSFPSTPLNRKFFFSSLPSEIIRRISKKNFVHSPRYHSLKKLGNNMDYFDGGNIVCSYRRWFHVFLLDASLLLGYLELSEYSGMMDGTYSLVKGNISGWVKVSNTQAFSN